MGKKKKEIGETQEEAELVSEPTRFEVQTEGERQKWQQ